MKSLLSMGLTATVALAGIARASAETGVDTSKPRMTTQSPISIVICGDSTVANYDTNKTTLRGWGQVISEGFASGVRIVNLARNGRSTKTFIREGLLARAVKVKADFALIQFGHNDSHARGRPESTDAHTNFKQYLRQFVDAFRAAGTEPVLITPMHRRRFDAQGRPTEELLPYAEAMKEVAAEKQVALVDLHASSGELLAKLGETGSGDLFHSGDRTHFDGKGARTMAGLVLKGLEAAVPRLKPYILRTDLVSADSSEDLGPIAPKPLYRDPVYDGAADPSLVWNPHVRRWWMFYTNRRANAPGLSGVTWVHGTRIGIAESADGGATWKYIGIADIKLPPQFGGDQVTEWAPAVITAPDGLHHMFLTVVPGIFKDWNHPRTIVHLTSTDLRHWSHAQPLKLATDRAIDPYVVRLPNGVWRLWYNNESDHKSIYYADSPDLKSWQDHGVAVHDQPGEGPLVFHWHGAYWMMTDVWHGLAVYRSDDALKWTRQTGGNLLEQPGHGRDDQAKGDHADVVVSGGRAFLFYFTHPGRHGPDANRDGYEQRRSSIQVVELKYKDGRLTCDRDEPTHIRLLAPDEEPADHSSASAR